MAEGFIIAGWMDYGEHRDEVLRHFADAARASRAEDGCLDYVITADPDHSGRLIVFERWASDEHLVAHFRTQHIADFRAAIEPYPRVNRDIRRFFVSRDEPFSSSRAAS